MQILTHRGLLHQYPENSLKSLLKATEAGFGIETDLRLTKDKDFLLIHDDNFKRLTLRDIKVSSLTLNEAMKLTYIDTHTHFSSLEEFLTRLRKTNNYIPLAIHLKTDSQTDSGFKKIVEYWENYHLYDNAFVFDLTINAAKQLKKLDNRIKIAFTVSEFKFEPTVYLWKEVKDLDFFDIVWAAEYKNFYTKNLIKQMKEKKEKVYTMSPDVHKAPHILHPLAYNGYEKTWRKLISWKVEGICTDEPFKLLKLL